MWMCQDNDSDIPACGICEQCKSNIRILKKCYYKLLDKIEAIGANHFFGINQK